MGRKRRPPFRLVRVAHPAPGRSRYRILDNRNRGIQPINEFLDYIAVRGLSDSTVRTYGFDLLHFWRWFAPTGMKLEDLTESALLDYIRSHYDGDRKPAGIGINHRLVVVRSFYHHCAGRPLGSDRSLPQGGGPVYEQGANASVGYLGRTRRRHRRLRVATERRVVVPLSSEEVVEFFESFRTYRDLGIVGLMLSCGLRTREVLHLRREDISFTEGQILVRGKGRKQRIVPLPPEVASVLESYLEVERPAGGSDRFFVSLKGRQRGYAMTPAGIRSLFRHHRSTSGVGKANPHRLRHTFGTDLARAGMSIPALMHLMGHETIQTTMLYVTLSPKDVWEEYRRAAARIRTERDRKRRRR